MTIEPNTATFVFDAVGDLSQDKLLEVNLNMLLVGEEAVPD